MARATGTAALLPAPRRVVEGHLRHFREGVAGNLVPERLAELRG